MLRAVKSASSLPITHQLSCSHVSEKWPRHSTNCYFWCIDCRNSTVVVVDTRTLQHQDGKHLLVLRLQSQMHLNCSQQAMQPCCHGDTCTIIMAVTVHEHDLKISNPVEMCHCVRTASQAHVLQLWPLQLGLEAVKACTLTCCAGILYS